MKMKSIFLSMLAIAALASCSKEEAPITPGSQGEEVTVQLTVGGSPLTTKVGGAASNAGDIAVNNLSIFGVNATGTIVSKAYTTTFKTTDGDKKTVDFKTSTQVTAVYVVANTASDLTTGNGALNVTTLKGLKNATAGLLASGAPSQAEADVLMAGENTSVTITPATTNDIAVTLGYIGAKIILRSVSRGSASEGAYNTDFNLQHVYLNNVNTSAYFFAEGGSHLAAITATGNERPAITKTLATGMTGGSGTVVADFAETFSPLAFDPGTKVENIAYWFVFENDEALTGTPTTLLIHYGWKKNKNDVGLTDMYFPVRFAAGDAFTSGTITPGHAYAVDVTLNGNFKPLDNGGSGGGGGTGDPDVPVVSTDVTVTVTPVAWDTSVNVAKPF